MKKFFEPFDVNPDPEHIDIPNYDRLGVITGITFPECQNSDTVRIHIAPTGTNIQNRSNIPLFTIAAFIPIENLHFKNSAINSI